MRLLHLPSYMSADPIKQSCLHMLARWARWAAGVDDDSTVYEYIREQGKTVAEGIKDDGNVDDGFRYPKDER